MAFASKFARLGAFFAALSPAMRPEPTAHASMLKYSSFAEITAYFWDLNRDKKLPQNYHGMSGQVIVFQDSKNENFSSFDGDFRACCDEAAAEFIKFACSQNLDVREFSAPVNAKIAEILPINWGEIKDALKTNEDIVLVAFGAKNNARVALVRVRYAGEPRGKYGGLDKGETINSVIYFGEELAQILGRSQR